MTSLASLTQTVASPSASASNASGAASAQSPPASSAASLDYNAFLKLLMAQMKAQDPTKPTDSTEWVSQLATFSNVEQAVQMNAKLDGILSSQSLADAEAVIGRIVTSADGSISGRVLSVQMTSGSPTANLEGGGTLTLTSGVTIS